jgi:glutamyl-tRNA synthetase
MLGLKTRAELLVDLKQLSIMYVVDFSISITEEAKQIIANTDDHLLKDIKESLVSLQDFNRNSIQEKLKEVAEKKGMKLGELMHFIRAFIAGDVKSPSVFEMIEILGLENSLYRLKKLI